jgi:DNA-binding NarL/FixJ family response regulator
VFVDEGDALGPLLRVITGHEGVGGYAARLLAALGASRPIDAHQSPDRTATGLLTERERAVLELLAEGLSNRAIAAQLVTSEGTIKSHVHHLIGKFGVATRAQVLVRARQEGLLSSRRDG